MMLRISVVGTGYVGLSTAVCFASRGYGVLTSTRNTDNLRLINAKQAPFYEPMLTELLTQSVESGNLHAVYSREEAVADTDVTFVTVGTPERSDGSINLDYVASASSDIGKALGKKGNYHLVVIKSTVIPGTADHVIKPILEETSGKETGVDFGLCMNPEFLKQGSAIQDTLHPDRVIIGEHDNRTGDVMHKLFSEFYGGTVQILRMSLSSAEMVKYASNAFLATKVSFANEIANICEKLRGVDVTEVMAGVGLDHRINPRFLNAGAGFGGSCFPKDLKALASFAQSVDYKAPLLRSVLEINAAQAQHVADLAIAELQRVSGRKASLLGLSFKPETDDLREAPALKIARALLRNGTTVAAYDPVVKAVPFPGYEGLLCTDSIQECLKNSHCCILATEWEQFKSLTPDDFINNMSSPVLIDARRIFDAQQFAARLRFIGIGLGL
jgi:nucleotide sugar dehydrogenase